MSDNATVDFYNKFVERLRIKLNDTMIAGLHTETKLAIAEEKIHMLNSEKEALEKKIKSLEKKVSD